MTRSIRRLQRIGAVALAALGAYLAFSPWGASAPRAGSPAARRIPGPEGPDVVPEDVSTTLAARAAAPTGDVETRLEGVVLDAETGDAVVGAAVRWGTIETRTRGDGTYRLRAAGGIPDVEEIVAAADGYADGSTSCDRQVWSAAGRLAPIFLARVRERRPGRVRDGLDRPVGGAVILVGPRRERFVSRPDGSFGPVGIGDRGVEWRAFSPSEGRAQGTWTRASEGPELEVTMPLAAFVPGEVVDEAGRAVGDAEVFLLRLPDELRMRSGPDGRFRWPLAPAGSGLLAAVTAEGAGFVEAYAGAPATIVVRRGEGLPGPSSASPPPSSDPRYGGAAERVTMRSRIVDDRGRPVAGAAVWVSAPDGSWRVLERTDADGGFALEVYAVPVDVSILFPLGHPGAGDHWTRRVDAGRTALPPRIELTRRVGKGTEAESATPRKPRVLEGRVLDAEGRPVPGVDVGAPGSDAQDTTDARGAFVLEGLPIDGPARVTVRAGATPPVVGVAAPGVPRLDVTLPARGAIVVVLRGAPEGDEERPGPEIRLGATAAEQDVFLESPRFESGCVTDLGDRVRIDAPVGRHVLRFRRAPGAWIQVTGVEVAAGRETLLSYDFAGLGRLRCAVVDPDGRPVVDAAVSLAEMDSLLGYTGSDGVLVPRLEASDATTPAGRHRLRVVTDDFVPAFTEPVELGRDVETTVRLARGEALVGAVAEAGGGPSRAGTLWWRGPHGPPVYLGAVDGDGAFGPLVPLPAGAQVLRLVRNGLPDVDLRVDVRPGAADRPLQLRLPPD